MRELIYKFLLQSGYPRASIITQPTDILPTTVEGETTFIIVDPDTVDRLAAIAVINNEPLDVLKQQAQITANFARKLGGSQAQGFIVRVDAAAANEGEQVQFYKCWPTEQLQQLSARTFPDFESLKVHYKLKQPPLTPDNSTSEVILPDEDEDLPAKLGWSAYVPSMLLFLFVVIDWLCNYFLGFELLNGKQATMLTVAIALLSLPALVKYLARS